MPRTAILYIAERCNQSCVFCLEVDGKWSQFTDPSTDEVRALVGQLHQEGARHITFMGGETLFRKDLPAILREARRVGFTRVGVTTNGTVLHKKGFLGELLDAGLAFIELSIHGHTAELTNRINGTSYTFDRQAAALAELDAMGSLYTIVNVVVCRENKDHLRAIARYVCEGFPRIPVRFKFKFVSLQGLAASEAQRTGDALRYHEVDVEPVGDYLAAAGVPFWFYNFPLCRLGRHAAHSHELATLATDERYFDYDHWGEDAYNRYYDSGSQLAGHVWPERACVHCTLRPICPGLEEQYFFVDGARALAAAGADPAPLVAFALRDAGRDPGAALARLEALRAEPRPSQPSHPSPFDGVVRLRHPEEPHPLALEVAERAAGMPAFLSSARYRLTYRRWEGEDVARRARVATLLDALRATLAAADGAQPSLDALRAEVVARAAQLGWSVDAPPPPANKAPSPARAARKGALPMLPSDLR
jgi:pyruvate-formate lyase-activating enzyme